MPTRDDFVYYNWNVPCRQEYAVGSLLTEVVVLKKLEDASGSWQESRVQNEHDGLSG